MKLRIISEAYDKNLAQKLAQQLSIDPKVLRQTVENIDPDLRYGTWVLKQIKEKTRHFNPETDGSFLEAFAATARRLKTALEVFDARKDELQSQDINAYSSESLISATEQLKPIEQGHRIGEKPGAKHLFSERDGDNLYELYEISDPATLCDVAEGSSWCVRQSYHAKSYLGRQNQVVILKNGAPTCLFAADLSEIKNTGNTDETRPEILRLVKRAGSILNRLDKIAGRIIESSKNDASTVIDFSKLVKSFIETILSGQATEEEIESPQVQALLDPDNLDGEVAVRILSSRSVSVPYAEAILKVTGKRSKAIEDFLAYSPDGRFKRQLNKFVGSDMGLAQLFNAVEYWRAILRPSTERYPQLEQAIISALDMKLLLGKHNDAGTTYVIEGIDEYVRKVLGGEWPEYYTAVSEYATRYPHMLLSLAERCLWDMLTSVENAVQMRMARVYLKLIEDFPETDLSRIRQATGGLNLLLRLRDKIELGNRSGLGFNPDILDKLIVTVRPELGTKEGSNTTYEVLTRKKILEKSYRVSDSDYKPVAMVGTGLYRDANDQHLAEELKQNKMITGNGYFRATGTDIMEMVSDLCSFLAETTDQMTKPPVDLASVNEILDYCVVGFTNGIEMAELVLTIDDDSGDIVGRFGFIADTADGEKYCHTWQPDRDNWQANQIAFPLPEKINEFVTNTSFGRKVANEFHRVLMLSAWS